MGKIVVTEFVSLDGVMEDPGGAEGFEHGGWAFLLDRGDESERFKFDETFGADAMLLGRRTYDEFAKAWPSREGEFADRFNSMPKYVYSSTLDDSAVDEQHPRRRRPCRCRTDVEARSRA